MTAPEHSRLARGEVREPLKIVVCGGSVSVFVVPWRASRDQGTYGELLPRLLADHGVTATTEHTGQWFDLVCDLRRRYETAVRNRFPDVLILNYGMGECQPNVIPTWLSRHFQSWDRSSAPLAVAYREHVAPRLWRQLRQVQRGFAARQPERSWRLSPDRFVAEMRHVITMARDEVRPLVLVLDLDPPGSRFEHWVPGIGARRELYQERLAREVEALREQHGGEVRFVRASETAFAHGVDEVLPDGIHRTAAGHRLTADLLLAEILDWLADR